MLYHICSHDKKGNKLIDRSVITFLMQNHQQMASQKSALLQSYSSKNHLNVRTWSKIILDIISHDLSTIQVSPCPEYISTFQFPSKEYLSIQKSYNLKVTTYNPLKEQAIVSVTWASRGSIFAAFLKNSWAFSVCPSWTYICPRTYRKNKNPVKI